MIIYEENSYKAQETVTIKKGIVSYDIDLHIEISDENENPDDPTNLQPKAIAGGPYYGTINVVTNFDGSDSYDSDGNISKYEWDLGDGTKKSGVTQNHTYDEANTYIITLTVTDDKGKTDLDVTYAYITDTINNPPTSPIINGITTGSTYTRYNYTTYSTDLDNDTIQYLIDWGDDSGLTSSNFLQNATTYTANHSWINPGIFTLTVYAIDEKDVASPPTRKTILIDTIYCKDIGYITDYTDDSVYDLFYSNTTRKETPVDHENGLYLIDIDSDGRYDYQYDIITFNLSTYTQASTNEENTYALASIERYLPLIIFIVVIVFITLVILLVHKSRRKTNKKDSEGSKVKEKKKAPAKKPTVNKGDKKSRDVEEEIDRLLSKKQKKQ